ncbi:MAG: VCBS repeat-containing protein, partial [Myxococcota bacterium]
DQRENRLWLNNGQGLFVERGLQSGCAVNAEGRVEGSMGVDAGDFDGDGNLDLFMAHVDEETNTLFRGLGNGLFRDVSIRSGVGAPSLGLTGFAVRWLDYDFDGVLDLAVFNGAVKRQESRVTKDRFGAYQQPHMLLKGSRGSFSVVRSSGFATPSVARGVAFGDLDNDGDEDLVMSAVDGPARVFINSMSSPSGRWTALSAEDDIIQARIEHGSRWFFPRRFGGFLSSHDRRVVLGPIDCRPDSRIEVKTSDGVVRFVDATCGGYAVLEHGTDR